VDRNPTFEKTILPLRADLLKRALRVTRGDMEGAEDLLQETLMRAFRFWHSFEPGTGARQWAFTILRNTHITRYQRANRRREIQGEARQQAPKVTVGAVEIEGAVNDFHGAVEAAQTAQRVRDAVAALPPMYADAVRLVDLEGLSTAEAAEALGCAPGTVNSRAYRGRKRLREILATG
jgi:RNA polymerase sigma-70 factor (ECF subfamily)